MGLILFLLGMIGAVAGPLEAADAPYIGRWKPNLTNSGLAVKFSAAGRGRIAWSGAILPPHTFKIDGHDYPLSGPESVAYTRVDAHTWKVAGHANGTTVATGVLRLSADNRTLTITLNEDRSDKETYVLTRVSGRSGLIGEWRSRQIEVPTEIMELSSNGEDGLTLTVGHSICRAKFDGQDYPLTGGRAEPGTTIALTRTGARSFTATHKHQGKLWLQVAYIVSEDGRHLTSTARTETPSQANTVVYDRQ